jgi:glycosyltransferase involved in cell wall biosynthesis
MKNPKVSVVIPTHNRAKLITRALDSLKNQTNQDFEIFIIDDASTDNTEDVINNYNDSKIKYIRLSENVGQSKARNIAIKQANGEYIGFLDSDDEWLPEKIEKQLKLFEQSNDPRLAAVYCGSLKKDEIHNKTSIHKGGNVRGDIYVKLLSGFCPSTPTLFLVKKAVLIEVQGFDEFLPTFVDYDLWLRIARLGHTFDVVDEPLIVKHEHAGSQIAKDPEKRERGLDLFLEKWGEELIEKAGPETYHNLRLKKLESLVSSITNNPGDDYKKDASRSIKLLLGVRSRRIKLYVKLIILLLLTKNTLGYTKKLKNVFKRDKRQELA